MRPSDYTKNGICQHRILTDNNPERVLACVVRDNVAAMFDDVRDKLAQMADVSA
jgi:hypothetical protein